MKPPRSCGTSVLSNCIETVSIQLDNSRSKDGGIQCAPRALSFPSMHGSAPFSALKLDSAFLQYLEVEEIGYRSIHIHHKLGYHEHSAIALLWLPRSQQYEIPHQCRLAEAIYDSRGYVVSRSQLAEGVDDKRRKRKCCMRHSSTDHSDRLLRNYQRFCLVEPATRSALRHQWSIFPDCWQSWPVVSVRDANAICSTGNNGL